MTDYDPFAIPVAGPQVSVDVDEDGAEAHASVPFPGRRRAPANVRMPSAPPAGQPTSSTDRSSTDTSSSTTSDKDDDQNDDTKAPGADQAEQSNNGETKSSTEAKPDDQPTDAGAGGKPTAPPIAKDPIRDATDRAGEAVKGTPLDPKNLPPIDPSALQPLAQIPLTALTAAMGTVGPMIGMLGPLIAARQQFGNGDPTQDQSRFPRESLDDNARSNDNSDWDGKGKRGYRGSSDKKKRKNDAIARLDEGLKKLLGDSGENTRLGREKTQQILDDVNNKLTTLQPIANTAAGQAQVLAIMTQAIQQAGGVVASGQQQSGVNGTQLRGLASQYTADLAPSRSISSRGGDPNSVDGAIEYALDAHGITDPAARRRWRHGYKTLIQRESGGNRFAVGDNGKAHSLTQTHTGTFNAYHVPGTPNDINHGGANVAASMAYVMDRYDVDKSGINLESNVQQADATRSPKGY